MAFYPDVYPGDKAVKTASEENALRHILNAGDGMSDRSGGHGQSRSICVGVYNAMEEDIPAGAAVRIDEKAEAEPFPVKMVEGGHKGFYGVLKTPLAPTAVGSMIVSGVALLSRAVGKPYAVPEGEGWKGTEDGGLLVLNPSTEERALAVIGGGMASGNQFEDFCKTLTNFCYIDGKELVVTQGRVGLGGDELYFWRHEELRIAANATCDLYAWATASNNKISYGIGTTIPPAMRKARRLICHMERKSGQEKPTLTRYHIGGDIIIDGYMGLAIWDKN